MSGGDFGRQRGLLLSRKAALRALGLAPKRCLDISALIGPPMEHILHAMPAPYGGDRIAVAVCRAGYESNQMSRFRSRAPRDSNGVRVRRQAPGGLTR